MSALQKLSITHFRNISAAELRPSGGINLFYGENGSGKSSLLEAIHLLGLARSFRSSSQKPLIQNNQEECTLFGGLLDGQTLGLKKSKRGKQQLKVSGRKASNIAELAYSLPLQLINSDTFKILEGNPKVRRHFLDWGVFHMEHRFMEQWRQMQKALKNRNSLLKRGAEASAISPWTKAFVNHALQIDEFRKEYLEALLPIITKTLASLIELDELSIEYDCGWAKEDSLDVLLDQTYSRDLRYGYTVAGPQRADIKIKIGQSYAVDILSRGQQKLLVSALKVSQGLLLESSTNKSCVYLIDDLSAELDKGNRSRVCKLLESLDSQVFITTVEQESLEDCWLNDAVSGNEKKLFHVKHGKIFDVESI